MTPVFNINPDAAKLKNINDSEMIGLYKRMYESACQERDELRNRLLKLEMKKLIEQVQDSE